MKKALSLVAVAVLIISLALCVGCGKKDKETASNNNATSSVDLGVIPDVEGMPEQTIGTQTDSSGNVVYVETIIPEAALDNPAEYNQQQAQANAQSSAGTSSAQNNSTTSSGSGSTVSTENNSSASLNVSKDTELGYNDDMGWIN